MRILLLLLLLLSSFIYLLIKNNLHKINLEDDLKNKIEMVNLPLAMQIENRL